MTTTKRPEAKTPAQDASEPIASSQTPAHPPDTTIVRRKVCLVGEQGVGKTSLIHRFVTGEFDPRYLRTLGAAVSKKTIALPRADGSRVQVELVVLDIMGKRTFLQVFEDAYLSGAAGVVAVFDLTHRDTLRELGAWLAAVRKTVGPIPTVVLGNKADLQDRVEVRDEDIASVLGPFGLWYVRTSAKSGENVEEAFLGLAQELVAGQDVGKDGTRVKPWGADDARRALGVPAERGP